MTGPYQMSDEDFVHKYHIAVEFFKANPALRDKFNGMIEQMCDQQQPIHVAFAELMTGGFVYGMAFAEAMLQNQMPQNQSANFYLN